jgi:hypothetical protein
MYDELFGKDKITEYQFEYPCKKSSKLTELRKAGDKANQYVINIHYLDTLYGDGDEIYSSYDDDECVYSYYHSECEWCKNHVENVKKNLIVGYKIYPKGMFPEKTHKQRKAGWKKYRTI